MVYRLLSLLGTILLVGCKTGTLSTNNPVIEYQVDKETYAVVVVRTGDMSAEEAKKRAMGRAAEKTQSEHQRYFTIESEGEVKAMTAKGSAYDSPPPPRNMYYELIQSDNFGRDRFEDERSSREGIYPAYRVVFKCYSSRPSKKAIDSCEIVPCKGN